MKYNVTATFNIDISEELAKNEWDAAKFIRSIIDYIACDKEDTYVGCIPKDFHQRMKAARIAEDELQTQAAIKRMFDDYDRAEQKGKPRFEPATTELL